MNKFTKHLRNWRVEYIAPILGIAFVQLAIIFHYWRVGRNNALEADGDPWQWIINAGPRIALCLFALVLISLKREMSGTWLTKDQKLTAEGSRITMTESVCAVLTYAITIYAFLH